MPISPCRLPVSCLGNIAVAGGAEALAVVARHAAPIRQIETGLSVHL